MAKPESPTDSPYSVGQVVNGHRWNGREWEPVRGSRPAAKAYSSQSPITVTLPPTGRTRSPRGNPTDPAQFNPYGGPLPPPTGTRTRRRWWLNTRVWAAAIIFVAFWANVVTALPGFRNPTAPVATPTLVDSATPSPTFTIPADIAADPDRAAFATKYGGFDLIVETGDSPEVIAIPENARAGIATFDYYGSDRFSITGIGADDHETAEPRAIVFGTTGGSLRYGDRNSRNPVSIAITSDDPWTLKLEPFYAAKELTLPASGTGPGVFLYRGGEKEWLVRHSGFSNFSVNTRSPDGTGDLLVNEIGDSSVTVPAPEGPTIIAVQTEGDWYIQEP